MGRGKTTAKGNSSLFTASTIVELAEKYSCSPAQILIVWGLGRNTSVIPKATSTRHLKDNFNSLRIQLEEEDMRRLNSIPIHHRFGWGNSFLLPGNPYENVFDE